MLLCIGGGYKAIPRLIRNKRTSDAKLLHLLHATPFEVYIFTGAEIETRVNLVLVPVPVTRGN